MWYRSRLQEMSDDPDNFRDGYKALCNIVKRYFPDLGDNRMDAFADRLMRSTAECECELKIFDPKKQEETQS